METFITGERVRVRTDAFKIRKDLRNCLGTVLKWTFENYYIVKMDNKMENGFDEPLLSGNEITKV